MSHSVDSLDYDADFDGEEDDRSPIEQDEDYWTCEFPGRCCMPSLIHSRDECYTPEMAEEYYEEMLKTQ